jgi:hypothetical protein
MIEDALRETFAAQASSGPPLDDASDQAERFAAAAMRRAARTRQLNALGTALAGVLVVALVSVATLQAMSARGGEDTGASSVAASSLAATTAAPAPQNYDTNVTGSPVPLPIEVVAGGEVYTEDKSRVRITLPDKIKPANMWRVKEGYLVLDTAPEAGQRLLLLDTAGSLKAMLVSSASRIVVSPAGDRVAWLYSGMMAVAAREPNKTSLATVATIKAPLYTAPVAFLGVNVVLGRTPLESTTFDAYSVWYPSVSTYTEQWDDTVVRLFGAKPDGSAMYAQVRDPDNATKICFALLVPDQPFKVTAKTCGLPEPTAAGGGISPDGRWLAYPVKGESKVAAVDLKLLFSSTPTGPVLWSFKAPCTRTIWVGKSSLAVDTGGKFVQLDPTQPNKQETAQGTSTGTVLVEPLTAS